MHRACPSVAPVGHRESAAIVVLPRGRSCHCSCGGAGFLDAAWALRVLGVASRQESRGCPGFASSPPALRTILARDRRPHGHGSPRLTLVECPRITAGGRISVTSRRLPAETSKIRQAQRRSQLRTLRPPMGFDAGRTPRRKTTQTLDERHERRARAFSLIIHRSVDGGSGIKGPARKPRIGLESLQWPLPPLRHAVSHAITCARLRPLCGDSQSIQYVPGGLLLRPPSRPIDAAMEHTPSAGIAELQHVLGGKRKRAAGVWCPASDLGSVRSCVGVLLRKCVAHPLAFGLFLATSRSTYKPQERFRVKELGHYKRKQV